MNTNLFQIHDEVKAALAEGKAVVALESTIVSHGMPYPDNVKMQLEVHELIRELGAVPATIALMDGRICIGLDDDQIERLGTAQGVVKTSVRDIPRVLSANQIGATTVAATAYAADQAGIRFFATGGLGGVHRGAAETFDISADLPALAQYDVCVFSSGVKSILDIPKTLEYLETSGVPVYGFETDRYPGFYVRDSGQPIESVDAEGLVALLRTKEQLGLKHSVAVAVPIPAEHELDREKMEATIHTALKEADAAGIAGKPVTPFLLSKIKESTGGTSLASNIALMKNNAAVAAKIAVAFHAR
ncbi:pseudouridine-5'-phosphate glycosidase [Brevibacillus fluminis]|uniref:pseudouridine-5'-phosphate glycosidase n=1 Tax=Brevibacillus fluminis TaxID=511487 RepID=UPI003F8AE036